MTNYNLKIMKAVKKKEKKALYLKTQISRAKFKQYKKN